MNTTLQIKKQNGAALIVGLILLVVITVLAVSGMNTATTELAMARNDQNYENALAQGQFTTLAGATITKTINNNDAVTAQIDFEDSTLVPDRAFSLGVGSGVSAYHFLATSTAESRMAGAGTTTDRDSTAVHTQAFYVVGPEAPTF